MPKINAATVVEHRARQRGVLLDAARELLLGGGYAALSFGALAKRAGLARPTVYSYFATKDDVVVALCEAELPLVAAEILQAVAGEAQPRDRLAALVRAQLGAASSRRNRLAHALVDAPLGEGARQRIVELHRELMPNTETILAGLGHPDPALAAALLQGMINAAVTVIDAGEPVDRVTRAAVDAVLDGFDATPTG